MRPLRWAASGTLYGRQSCRFLETGSLHPPLAALRPFPPFSFVLPKENAPRPVEEKSVLCPNLTCSGQVWTRRGAPERDLGRSLSDPALGAVLVLAISISLAFGLRQKLTHSDARPLPTKTAPLGFRGDPEVFGFQPRESELQGRAKTARTSVPFRCRWPGAPG